MIRAFDSLTLINLLLNAAVKQASEALDPVPPPSRDFPTLSAGTFRCCWLFFRQGMGHGKHPALHTED